MSATATAPPRFVRRTQLGPQEYRKNFRQIDGDIIAAVTSVEADSVTPLMSKIYLRLAHAPARYWERDGVLRFEAELRDDAHATAWAALCEVAGVASATARKALRWMHEQGIIGYFAGKNGAGVRVFLNRAASSIGSRAGQKILEFSRASSGGARTSAGEAAFSDSFADLEISDTDKNPLAPQNGAEQAEVVKTSNSPHPFAPPQSPQAADPREKVSPPAAFNVEVPVGEIVSRLRRELEPSLRTAARTAAAQEHERTRAWFETRALPKAIRVAQSECFQILKKEGSLEEKRHRARADLNVGRGFAAPACREARPRTPEEIDELAEMCVALLQVQGQPVDVTLAGISAEGGGWLLPDEASRVRAAAERLLTKGEGRR